VITTKVGVNKRSVDMLVAGLKELGKDAQADLGKNMRRSVLPLGKIVASQVPTGSPFKGMQRNYYGEVQWQQPTAKLSVTPNRKRGEWTPLVSLLLTGKPKLGFDYAENAGPRRRAPKSQSKTYQRQTDSVTRSHSVTTQGNFLIKKARQVSKNNFKAGHFAYGNFLKLRPAMITIAVLSLEQTARKWNVKVN